VRACANWLAKDVLTLARLASKSPDPLAEFEHCDIRKDQVPKNCEYRKIANIAKNEGLSFAI